MFSLFFLWRIAPKANRRGMPSIVLLGLSPLFPKGLGPNGPALRWSCLLRLFFSCFVLSLPAFCYIFCMLSPLPPLAGKDASPRANRQQCFLSWGELVHTPVSLSLSLCLSFFFFLHFVSLKNYYKSAGKSKIGDGLSLHLALNAISFMALKVPGKCACVRE